MYAKNWFSIWVTLIFLSLLSACSTPDTPTVQSSLPVIFTLQPFNTKTPATTPAPPDLETVTPLPSPSPTMQIHRVEKGDDLGGIAFRYQVTLAQLMAANPDVNPNMLSIGTELNIPAAGATTDLTILPSPTPFALPVSPVWCARTADKGAWCSILVSNPYDTSLENIEAEIRATNPETGEQLINTASAALNLLPPGKSIPLVTFFSPILPVNLQFDSALKIAMPAPQNDQRYLPVRLENQITEITGDGLSASVTVDIFSDLNEDITTSQVWVLLTAFDNENHVIGFRRLESNGLLKPDQGVSLQGTVYSFSGPISRVETMAEARP